MGSFKDYCNITMPRSELACPICRDLIQDVYSTPCGHSFCYACIMRNLEHRQLCPCCSNYVTKDRIYPNVLLGKLIKKAERLSELQHSSSLERLRHTIESNDLKLDINDIEELEKLLTNTKARLQMEGMETQMQMLQRFLTNSRDNKKEKVEDLSCMLKNLELDIAAVAKQRQHIKELQQKEAAPGGAQLPMDVGQLEAGVSSAHARDVRAHGDRQPMEGNMEASSSQQHDSEESSDESRPTGALEQLMRTLSVYSYQNKLEVLSQVQLQTGMLSSLEFNKDGTLFATAGVHKHITVMNSEAMKAGAADIDAPVCSMITRAKLNSLSWNKFQQEQLVSSDNEGVLTLWDTNSGQIIQDYEAHERRIWSVDFSHTDPHLLVSGSDDGKVKVWSTKERNGPAVQIDIRVNVCSVSYSKTSSHHVAIGSADKFVRVFDLRNPSLPLTIFQGHNKAISYVDFINDHEVISASTDSTLRLWDIPSRSQLRVFTGHKNARNFVGMSVHKDFIACGSEASEVFIYYKAVSKPLVAHSFGHGAGQEFMSTVSWQPNSSTLFAVSSTGMLKALQLSE